MSLINCPECQTEVSDKAEKCPKCAFPIHQSVKETEVKPQIVVKAKEGFFLQTMNVGCIIGAVIIGIIILIFIIALASG